MKTALTSEETEHLAPTYGHASSLGRDLSDSQRQKRSVDAYANKCFSAFYGSVDDRKTLKTFDVFSLVANRYPEAACVWLARLENISKARNTILKTTKTLFLAWQDPISRFWFPIGRLTFDQGIYQFAYTQGVKEAQDKSAFKALSSFPRLDEIYTSTQLFAVFANRLMSRSRPDYSSFIEWLNIPNDENDPITILARSGGERETDTLAVFPCPEVDKQGQYHVYFFSHGLRHLPSSAIERINQLESGQKLWLAHEFQNPYDSQALILNTEDHYIVGYCPRYLLAEVFELLRQNFNLKVRVERVNKPPTPLQFRLLCKMTGV